MKRIGVYWGMEKGSYIEADTGKKYRLLEDTGVNSNSLIFHVKACDEQEKETVFLKFCCEGNDNIYNLERESQFCFFYPFIEHIREGFWGRTSDGYRVFCVSGDCIDGMELLEYRRRREKELKEGVITWEELEAEIFSQMLQFLYGINYYTNYTAPPYFHRDLKPNNVMITEDGRVVIIDFDNAHISNSNETMAGRRFPGASKGYAHPLTIKRGAFSQKSDIYSAGRVLFYWLNGQEYYSEEELETGDWCNIDERPELAYGMEADRFLPVYRQECYTKLLRVLADMVSEKGGYSDIREVLEDMKRFLIEYYGNSIETYQKMMGLSKLPILAERLESERTCRRNVLYRLMASGERRHGGSLSEYEMREIVIEGKLLMMIYNLGGEIYYIPFYKKEGAGPEDFEICDQDVLHTEYGEIEFCIR